MSEPASKRLRKDQTDAEKRLWAVLRNRNLAGYKFRRQAPIGAYIADFVCLEENFIIEIDGGQHAVSLAKDEQRTKWLENEGYRVLRFWNNEVLENLEGVKESILIHLTNPSP